MAVPGALQWRTRRGLLECDLALAAFLSDPYGYAALASVELTAFERLLEREDADLLRLFLGQAEAADPLERSVVKRIRQCAAVLDD
ncbi:MAG: succinate dehydrogenase assembly factor 2 [Thioalkalivibrionaceae bacterium]